ncbi:hypothetical protein ACWKWC_15655 [Geodermatophilus nigrescens]
MIIHIRRCAATLALVPLLLAAVLAGQAASSRAQAAWAIPGGGTAQAAAAAIPAPATPTVTGSGLPPTRTFTVTWTAPPPGPVPITGYRVSRTSSLLGAGVIGAGTCTGLTVLGGISLAQAIQTSGTFSCTDITAGNLGMVQYTVTPVYERWIGPASAWSSHAS